MTITVKSRLTLSGIAAALVIGVGHQAWVTMTLHSIATAVNQSWSIQDQHAWTYEFMRDNPGIKAPAPADIIRKRSHPAFALPERWDAAHNYRDPKVAVIAP